MLQPEYLRVTEILKPFSGVEFIPEKYLIPAGKRGTLVHSLIEAHLSGENNLDVPNEARGYFASFLLFLENDLDLTLQKLILEKRLFCEEKMITGAIDCVVEKEDGRMVIDWKTSAKASSSWNLQAAAYKYLCEQNGYENVKEVIFVKLDKYGKEPKIFKFDTYEKDLEIFDKCLEIYHFFEMHITRKK